MTAIHLRERGGDRDSYQGCGPDARRQGKGKQQNVRVRASCTAFDRHTGYVAMGEDAYDTDDYDDDEGEERWEFRESDIDYQP